MAISDIPDSEFEVVDPRYKPGEAIPMGKFALDVLYFQRHGRWFKSENAPRIRLRGSEGLGK